LDVGISEPFVVVLEFIQALRKFTILRIVVSQQDLFFIDIDAFLAMQCRLDFFHPFFFLFSILHIIEDASLADATAHEEVVLLYGLQFAMCSAASL
jgi:hypothetical protein